jgi:hypothetical protein
MEYADNFISYMTFAMEMLELHWGNTSIGIQIRGSPTDMSLQ